MINNNAEMLSLKVIIVGYTFLFSITSVSAMNYIFKVIYDMAIYNIYIHRSGISIPLMTVYVEIADTVLNFD